MNVITTVTSRIPEIIAESTVRAGAVVQATIHLIDNVAKQRSRVDTGQMRAGWISYMTGVMSGAVENTVGHVIFNEFGTVHMSAQPMLAPAVEQARPEFIAGMRTVYA